jgi:hypothetical protein
MGHEPARGPILCPVPHCSNYCITAVRQRPSGQVPDGIAVRSSPLAG